MKLKIDTNIVKNYSSIAAGVLIGLGVIINTTSINPWFGATLFSFGLLTIIALALPLYTGRIGFLRKEDNLFSILICNLIGVIITVYAYILANPDFENALEQTSSIKFSKGYFQILICGIFCGMLIHFAVKVKQPIITIMAIVIFISIGAEHCIADFPFLIANFSFTNLIKFLLVILGNSIGAILIEQLTKGESNEICKYNKE